MIVAASDRRPVSSCSRSSAGQVAIAMVVAHISPLRNGSSVHKLPTISTPNHDNRQHGARDVGRVLHFAWLPRTLRQRLVNLPNTAVTSA
jgi:hypothetical protein